MQATVSSKGWIVIPAELRKKYAIEPGTRVSIVDYGGVLSIVRVPDDPIEALSGVFAGGPSLTEALLEDRRAEREQEERNLANGDPG